MQRVLSRAALVAAIFAAGCAVGRTVEGPRAASADAPAADRVFELRTYTSPDGKLPDLETRFRDHTRRIFEKHGMTNIGYWKPMDGPEANNTLVYLLAHDSREAAQASWAAFRADPEWRQVAAASEVNGRIVSGVESVFLTPTDYSPLK